MPIHDPDIPITWAPPLPGKIRAGMDFIHVLYTLTFVRHIIWLSSCT